MWKLIFLILYLLILGVWDGRNKEVPTILLIFGMVTAIMQGVFGFCGGQSLSWYILGVLPGAVLLFIAWTTGKTGYADGIVLMIIGLFVGYYSCVMIWGISLFLVSLCAIALLAVRKVQKHSRLAYIPFLGGAYLLWCLFGG